MWQGGTSTIKILFITLEPPNGLSGGGLVVRQSLLSLAGFAELDYLGPEIFDEALKQKLNRVYILKHDKSCAGIAQSLVKGITTGYYRSWLAKSANLNWDAYDLVYLEYSRSGFIALQAKKKNKKLVVRVHNVEKDYYLNRVIERKSFQNSLRSLIKRYFITRQESRCLFSADCIICLTDKDKKRLTELYPANPDQKRVEVIPVALEQPCLLALSPAEFIEDEANDPYLLITGSLWFGPNADGAAWFIKQVWQKLLADNHRISRDYRLVVAGSKPGKEIRSLASCHKNVVLIDSPRNIKPYFKKASIYLAPIFFGAGMKVKVAEALSYGLPVIGTSHALTGYNIKDRESGYRADCANKFIDSLEHYTGLSIEDKVILKKKSHLLFLNEHSIEKSKFLFQRIVEQI
ncbi:MAG: glycosyltransferase family 4 protein [Firmicutes bacterium]|nr:glycosyltransferase family 4 protein [Bacillota bacterium]